MKKSLLVILFFVLLINGGYCQTDQFLKILQEADRNRAGQLENVSWQLQVKNYQHNELKNALSIVVNAKTTGKEQLALISFLAPKKFEGQKLLIRNNNMWFSKKGVERPIAISGRQRLTGSASNADVANANYSIDYEIKKVTDSKLDNVDCYLFELVANNNYVSYYKIIYWVSKNENTGLKAEYFGKSDKLIKTASFAYNNKVSLNGKSFKMVSVTTIKDDINVEDYTVLESSGFTFKDISLSTFDK